MLFEKSGSQENHPAPDVLQASNTVPTPLRLVQNSLPLTEVGGEAPTFDSVERAVADRARHVAYVVIENRGAELNHRWREQGFADAA